MKKGKIILGILAAFTTILFAFASSRDRLKGQSPTLCTLSGGEFHIVNCTRAGTGDVCPAVTYFTCTGHKNAGKIAWKTGI
jgi:hypothetical protein